MKQIDSTIASVKDSLRTVPIKSSTSTVKISQQDLLKQRAEVLKKQIESLRAKTSADMVRFVFFYHMIIYSKILFLASCNE
jgi:hypothetical protein